MRALVCAVVLVACAGSPHGGAVPDEGSEHSDDDAPETERERLVREATERRAQCQTLGFAIETAEGGGQEFVNLNDERALTRLARVRNQTAERLHGIELTAEPLIPIRDDYIDLNRKMADALQETATARVGNAKKAALARYRSHEHDVDAIIERFNSACDGT